MSPPTQVMNRYLEAIFYVQAEGESVRASRLAEWLGVSQPTASATLQRMVRGGLVQITPGKVVTLTERGKEAAARIVRTHRIAERWLTDTLGLDWVKADEEAGRLEHAMSDEVADRLYRHIGQPATCPHGNPIPGTPQRKQREQPLSSLPPGTVSRVLRVSEVAEHEAPELLAFLSQAGFRLGVAVKVAETVRGAGILTVDVGGHPVSMAIGVAEKIWVEG
jgi:DtxR family Mn-dependent transcriptional regulator